MNQLSRIVSFLALTFIPALAHAQVDCGQALGNIAVYDAAQHGSHIFLAGARDFAVLNVKDITRPTIVHREAALSVGGRNFGVSAVEISAARQILALKVDTIIRLYDIADAPNPSLLGEIDSESAKVDLSLVLSDDGMKLAVTTAASLSQAFNTLKIYNIEDPASPTLISETAIQGRDGALDTCVNLTKVPTNPSMLVCMGSQAMHAIDIANSAQPVVHAGENFTPFYSVSDVLPRDNRIAVHPNGQAAYVSRNRMGDDMVIAFNISNLTDIRGSAIVQAGHGAGGDLSAIAVSPNADFLISYQGYDQNPILSLADPLRPRLIDRPEPRPAFCADRAYFIESCHFSLPIVPYASTYFFHFAGSHMLEGTTNLRVWNMQDPMSPVLAGGISRYLRGDLNCDRPRNNYDIHPFVLAVSDPLEYQRQFRFCPRENADMNQDGLVNNFDVDAFVQCLVAGSSEG